MNHVEAIIVVMGPDGNEIRELGRTRHGLTDPGDDIQAIHGWKRYVAERAGLAVTATIASELEREDVTATEFFTEAEIRAAADALAQEPLSFEEAARQFGLGDLRIQATPEITRDLLLLVADEFPREDFPLDDEIAAWTEEQREEVAAWAAAHHARASDNEDVEIPAMPAVLEAKDEQTAADDEGAEAPASGEGGAPAERGEAGAASADGEAEGGAGDAAGPDGAPSGSSDGRAPEAGGEAHAGPEGAAAGGEGGGEVSRPRRRRSRRGEEAAT